MSEHIKTELSGTSEPLLPRPPLAKTFGYWCCSKCRTPFTISERHYTTPDGCEGIDIVHTPACKCRVPIWWTPEGKP